MPENHIQLGVIGRPHGVRGWVRVSSHTAEPADLTSYGPLSDGSTRRFLLRWMAEGVAEVSELVNGSPVKVVGRTAAEKLTNIRLFIDRAKLPPPEDEDEFYLADLIGLNAIDLNGLVVGRVATVHDYGAGTSLEIERLGGFPALLVPFTKACVPVIEIDAGRVTVSPPDEIIVAAAGKKAA